MTAETIIVAVISFACAAGWAFWALVFLADAGRKP